MIQYSKVNEKDLEQIIDLYEKYLNGGKYIRNAMYEAKSSSAERIAKTMWGWIFPFLFHMTPEGRDIRLKDGSYGNKELDLVYL